MFVGVVAAVLVTTAATIGFGLWRNPARLDWFNWVGFPLAASVLAVFAYRGPLRGSILARVELRGSVRGPRRWFHIRL